VRRTAQSADLCAVVPDRRAEGGTRDYRGTLRGYLHHTWFGQNPCRACAAAYATWRARGRP
jgi:hypothetical protein